MRIVDFEWDEGNSLHLQLGHGIEPEEAEEVFANKPFYRKTKKGHYAVFGPTLDGRYLANHLRIKAKRHRPSNNRLGYESSGASQL